MEQTMEKVQEMPVQKNWKNGESHERRQHPIGRIHAQIEANPVNRPRHPTIDLKLRPAVQWDQRKPWW
jgi:hypothetical protein